MPLKKFIIPLVSLFVILLLLELFVSRFFPQKTYTLAFKDNNNCYRESPFATFELKPNCIMKFKNFDTNEVFETKINSLGLRGDEFDPTKKKVEKRILLSGDSFILGFGVKDNEIISYDLEQLLKSDKSNTFQNLKVINAGYTGGFGPDGYYLHLKNKGIKLEPDLVVFSVFVYNDFSDIYNDNWIGGGIWGEPKKVISKTTTVDDKGYLVSKPTPLIYQIPILRESHLAILLTNSAKAVKDKLKYLTDKIRFKIFKPKTPSGEASDDNLLGAHITRCIFWDTCQRSALHLYSDLLSVVKASKALIEDTYKDKKTRFVVLLIPADFQIYSDAIENYRGDTGLPLDIAGFENPNPQNRLKEMFVKENIPYIDLLPVFKQVKQRAYFAKDGHWNALGHKIAATELAKWITTNYK